MAYSDKKLLTDAAGHFVPQYWDETAQDYKPLTDPTKVYAQGSLSDFRTTSMNITSTPVELTAGLTGRTQLICYPPDTGTIYWGQYGVTSGNGAPLKAGDAPVEFSFADTTLKIYAVSDGTDHTIRLVESK